MFLGTDVRFWANRFVGRINLDISDDLANCVLTAVVCRSNRREVNLVVRVRSFFSLPDGRPKSWMQGKTLLTQIVDIHAYGLQHLVDFITGHYMWG